MKYDYGIIGAGPAGTAAATEAAKKGKSVIIFEKDAIGGTCLNKGCIPTKTYLHAADMLNGLKNSEDIGIKAEKVSVDFKKLIERKNKVIQTLRKSMELTLKNNKVEYVPYEAEVSGMNTIEADGKTYECENIIVATGSKSRSLKGFEFDHKFILNSDDVLNITELPQKVLIVGSGAIGIEWARIFSAFGCEVTLVEISERLLPLADFEVSKRLERIFKSTGVKFYTSTEMKKIENKKVYLSNGEIIEPDFVFLAVGRAPYKPEIKGEVTYLGDVYGSIQLAHFASHQAVSFINGIPFDDKLVPSVVYGEPEIAWAGDCEQNLEEGSFKKVIMPVSALGKAHADNSTEGFIKLLLRNDYITGVHIISKEASALVHQVLIAMQNNVKIDRLKEVCFAHPTYSEAVYDILLRIPSVKMVVMKGNNK